MVEFVGSEEASGRPSRRESTGSAITSSTTTATSVVSTARTVDIGFASITVCCSCPNVLRALRVRTRSPTKRSIAGVSVTATTTATATQMAPTVPMVPMNGMPVTFSASRATTTVEPAKTTALPAVPSASPIDSNSSAPCISCFRCRLMMNSE